MTKGLLVHPGGAWEYVDADMTLDYLSAVVGGYIEYVFVTKGVHAYVNEEGKLYGLEPNYAATRLAGYEGVDVLVGPVIFLGDKPDGEEGDLPPEWLDLGQRMGQSIGSGTSGSGG